MKLSEALQRESGYGRLTSDLMGQFASSSGAMVCNLANAMLVELAERGYVVASMSYHSISVSDFPDAPPSQWWGDLLQRLWPWIRQGHREFLIARSASGDNATLIELAQHLEAKLAPPVPITITASEPVIELEEALV
jgi:hypothetical protein